MPNLHVTTQHEFIVIDDRQPDPAAGRTEAFTLARLTVDEAERLIESLRRALPDAKAATRKLREQHLTKAEQRLELAQADVSKLKEDIARLRAEATE